MDIPAWLGGPVEPNSDARQAAHAMREMFNALTEVGFTEEQSLTITIAFLTSSTGGNQ